jgi:hypothetical protein
MISLGLGLGIAKGASAAGWTPAALFSGGQEGFWFAPSPTTCFTDTARTTAASVGQAVAGMTDLSGNGNHMTQGTVSRRPTLRQNGALYYLEFDAVDDVMETAAIDLTAENTVGISAAFVGVDMTASQRTLVNQSGGGFNAFTLRFPVGSPSNTLAVRLLGDSGGADYNTQLGGFGATLDAICTVNGDMSGTTTLRVLEDGGGTASVASDATGAGAGEWSNGAIAMGARAGGVVTPFLGNVYGMIARFGSVFSAEEITQTEAYMGDLSGISL